MKTFITIILLSFPLLADKVISIDLGKQRLYARQDGKTFLLCKISSGRVFYETSTGDYAISFKEKDHRSNLYPKRKGGGAKMPFTMRFRINGEAIHAGKLPGFPDSHGCVRVSYRNAAKLFKWAEIGTRVIVYGETPYTDSVNRTRKLMGPPIDQQASNSNDDSPGTDEDVVWEENWVDESFMDGVYRD